MQRTLSYENLPLKWAARIVKLSWPQVNRVVFTLAEIET